MFSDTIDQEHQIVFDKEMKFGYGMIPAAHSGGAGGPISRKRLNETVQTAGRLVDRNDGIERVTFLGNDISMLMYQQQFEIDQFIAHHTEKMKYQMELSRRTSSMRLMIALEQHISKKLRSKDSEISKINKLNLALEEKAKSLIIENEIWKQMAENNETTANVLRLNLQRLVTDMQQQDENDDVESCCGSNQGNNVNSYSGNNNNNNRECKKCGIKESCVLLLPCRHLCICNVCESLIKFCPICTSLKNAIVHVNMS